MKKVIGALIILYIIIIVIFHLTYSYTTYWIDEEIIIGYTIIAFPLLLCCVCMLYTKWFQKILKRIFCWEIFSKIKLLLYKIKSVYILIMIPLIIFYIFSISIAKTIGY